MSETNDETIGYLRGKMESLENDVADLKADMEGVKSDVHDIKLTLSGLKGSIDALVAQQARQSSPRTVILIGALLAMGGYALYLEKINQWVFLGILLLAGVIHQHEKVTRLAEIVFRAKRHTSASPSPTASSDETPTKQGE